ATLGLYTRPWMHIHYPQMTPAVGRLEANAFEPARWKPEYPNPAFDSMRPDDAFWAARIVSKFTDQTIRAVVDKAQYSDPRTTDYLTGAIIKRRDKVMAYWLTQVNPLVDFALSDGGELTFANAAEQAGVASAATEYRVQWAQFDNSTGLAANVGDAMTVTDRRVQAPAPLVSDASAPEFIQVSVAAVHPQFPTWSTPVTLQFRRVDRRWTLVGLVRLPDASPQVITSTTSRKAGGRHGRKAERGKDRKKILPPSPSKKPGGFAGHRRPGPPPRQRRQQILGHREVVLQRIEQPFRTEPQTDDRSCGRGVVPTGRSGKRFDAACNHSRTPREPKPAGRRAVDASVEQHEEPAALVPFAPECRAWRSTERLALPGGLPDSVGARTA